MPEVLQPGASFDQRLGAKVTASGISRSRPNSKSRSGALLMASRSALKPVTSAGVCTHFSPSMIVDRHRSANAAAATGPYFAVES